MGVGARRWGEWMAGWEARACHGHPGSSSLLRRHPGFVTSRSWRPGARSYPTKAREPRLWVPTLPCLPPSPPSPEKGTQSVLPRPTGLLSTSPDCTPFSGLGGLSSPPWASVMDTAHVWARPCHR